MAEVEGSDPLEPTLSAQVTPEYGEPLAGGNMSGEVWRIGDTVRRRAGPWTPAVHALLLHLEQRGFAAAWLKQLT